MHLGALPGQHHQGGAEVLFPWELLQGRFSRFFPLYLAQNHALSVAQDLIKDS